MKNRKLKEKILELHKEGKSLCAIAKILGCSKSCVYFHVRPDGKEKLKNRNRKNRVNGLYSIISNKVWHFKTNRKKDKQKHFEFNNTDKQLLYHKIHTFSNNRNGDKMEFTSEDVLNKFGQNTKCYLTGEPIDLLKPRTYQFDHIIPVSKNGSNSLDNLGIACKKANQAKSNLELSEFIELCKKVLGNFGYLIQNPPQENDYCI